MRVGAERARENMERLFRLLAENSSDVVALLRPDGHVEWLSRSFGNTEEYERSTVMGRLPWHLLHPDDLQRGRGALAEVIATGGLSRPLELRFRVGTDEYHWVAATGRRVDDGHGNEIVMSFRDITDRKLAEQDLEYAATHDQLTGLANRKNLVAEIRRALLASHRSGRPTAVVMLDLDHFKFVNDSLGHAVGDDLLREAASRMRSSVRDGDFVARHGGDEFVVVMRDLEAPDEATAVAQRIVDVFRSPVLVGATELFTTASVGVAISRVGSDVDSLLSEADTAMYVSKDAGRDRCSLFNEELRHAATERLRIESGLRAALAHDELDVWYQPEIDVFDGHLTAVEALVRWHHPDRGLYTADRFIDVAEESGLIVEIGTFVIRRACAQAALWNSGRSARPLVVRINLSTRQLAEADLLDIVDTAMTTSDVDAGWLCFEITETAILRDIPAVARNVHGIHSRGIALALDDFGTGYASLSHLRELPISVLKLDRSFVASIDDNEFDRRLVAGVIALAHGLDITVTAEGVEHERQAEILRSLGCRRAQGFLYSAAVPAEKIDAG